MEMVSLGMGRGWCSEKAGFTWAPPSPFSPKATLWLQAASLQDSGQLCPTGETKPPLRLADILAIIQA